MSLVAEITSEPAVVPMVQGLSVRVEQGLRRKLAVIGATQRARRQQNAYILTKNLGMVPSGENALTHLPHTRHPLQGVDLMPHVIAEEEWRELERGLIQRTEAWQALLRDLYSTRRILRDRVLPHDLVLGNPRFLRECVGLPVPGEVYSRASAIDLVRLQDGSWRVAGDHCFRPFGLAFALQMRRIQSQIFPEAFEGVQVLPVAPITTHLLENLKSLAGVSAAHANLFILSESTHGLSDFENSFLARKMGMLLAQPQDFTVRAGSLYYRTIHGLERAHVLFRAAEGASLDPVARLSGRGIPGLFSCLRHGTVAATNAPGCSIADSLDLLHFTEKIVRYYLNEPLLLEPLATWRCSDPDQREEVRDQHEQFILKEVNNAVWSAEELENALSNTPGAITAFRRAAWATLSSVEGDALPFMLRCFAITNEQGVTLMPGGLTRTWPDQHPLEGGACIVKDTWIVREGASRRTRTKHEMADRTPKRLLGSRVAESLYWMGRYAERAEFVARQFNILNEIQLEASIHDDPAWKPLWAALSRVMGHPAGLLRPLQRKDPAKAALLTVFDLEKSSSVASCVRRARNNAQALLDYVSPESWTILNRLDQQLTRANESAENQVDGPLVAREAADRTLNQIAAFHGTMDRTMLHDEGTDFFHAGVYLERAQLTLETLHEVFRSPSSLRADLELENPTLIGLLRMLAVQDAYRRRFQRLAMPGLVMELILKERHVSVSVLFCVEKIQRLLRSLGRHCPEAVERAEKLVRTCSEARPIAILTARKKSQQTTTQKDLITRLDRLLSEVNELHGDISDAFFSHQSSLNQAFSAEMARERQ